MVKQNWKVFLEENFLKRHETAVVDELDRGVRNKWVWAWLDCQDANEDFYASYIRKLNVPGQAVCTICNRGGGKVINYSKCGIQALKRHAASKKHKSDRNLIRTNSSLPSSLQHTADIQSGAATPTRIVRLSEKLMPYGTPQHVRDQIVKDGSAGLECAPQKPAVSLSDRTSHQEALICTFVAENSLPLSVTPKLAELAKELSRDPKALSDVALSRRSATRKLVHGIHNVERKRLVSAMKTSSFSLNIDESTAKSNKKRVMNVLVSYFDGDLQQSVTKIYASVEMIIVNASTVYAKVTEILQADEVPLTNLISILSDSAAYMRGKKNGFQAKIKEDAPHLLDIDGDLCHYMHNIVKMFAKGVDTDDHFSRLLDDIYANLSYSADLRADLLQLCSLFDQPELVPKERIQHRWLSLCDANSRFQQLLVPLTIFYFGFLSAKDKQLYEHIITPLMNKLCKKDRLMVFLILRRLKQKNLTQVR